MKGCIVFLSKISKEQKNPWRAQRVDRDRLVNPQDLSGRSQIKLVKIHFLKRFQFKRMNGFRVMAFQSLAHDKHIWYLDLPWEIQKYCIVQQLL
jgi:hypothetical protein